VLATRFGVEAAHALDEGTFDIMVALQGGQIVRIPLEIGVGTSKSLDLDLLDRVAGPFLG